MLTMTLILVPLLVLPIVLLFRFIGCGLDVVATGVFPGPPNYRDYILSDPAKTAPGTVRAHPEIHPNGNDVIAYWRLIVRTGEHDSSAKDEKGLHGGLRVVAVAEPPAEDPTPSSPGSERGSKDQIKYGHASLIVSPDPVEPFGQCQSYMGGYVKVPPSDALYPDEFTIEAWVSAEWGDTYNVDYEHTLFYAGGHYIRLGDPGAAKNHGFAVVADKTGHWQVRFHGQGDLFTNPPSVSKDPNHPTHLAVTVAKEAGGTRARLFFNGTESSASNVVFYSPPQGAPLLIGVASKEPDALLTEVPHRPLNGAIQEVVLHRKALSAAEIENHVDINRVS